MHPKVQSEPPLAQLWTIPTCPVAGSTSPSLLSLLRELWRAMTLPLSLVLSNKANPKSLAAQSFYTFTSPKLLLNLLMGQGRHWEELAASTHKPSQGSKCTCRANPARFRVGVNQQSSSQWGKFHQLSGVGFQGSTAVEALKILFHLCFPSEPKLSRNVKGKWGAEVRGK